MPEPAIEHAMAAGDAEQVARLVLNVMQPVWASGRIDTVLSWMEWLEDRSEVEHYTGIAAHGALILALLGRPVEAERWAAAAERDPGTGTLPDGNTMAATLAYLRALLCRHGVAQMRRDAQLAMAGLSPASPYRATMLHAEGVSHLLDGDLDRADPLLAHAFDVATSAGAVPFLPVVLAERGIVAIMRDDWHEAGAFADQALAFVQDGSLDGTGPARWCTRSWRAARCTKATCSAPGSTSRGPLACGRCSATRCPSYQPKPCSSWPAATSASATPVAPVRCCAKRRTSSTSGPTSATSRGRQTSCEPPSTSDPGAMHGASSLTTAELRLLPLLPTHLTLGEIGERLHVTRNTVKTQAIAIYRKFGVSSRRAAISRMHELGLLPGE